VKLWRIICLATAAEASAASAAMGVLGLLGAFNGWLDVLNQFAPVWLFVGLAGGLGVHVLAPAARARLRRGLLGLAALGTAIGLTQVGPDMLGSIAAAFHQEPRPPLLKLVSLNAWSENAAPERTVQVILAAHPDVVAVQEAAGSFRQDDEALRKALPFRISCPAGTDLALFSRTQPTADSCSDDAESAKALTGFGPIWIRVRAGDGREVTVATTHMVWPFPPEVRKAQLRAAADALHRLGPTNLILAGDFNSSPWTFGMRRQDALFRPLTRRTHAIFTWPARFSRLRLTIGTPILAIDHVYADPALRSAHVRRLPLTGSDHYGIVAWFYG
jgi:endonuclease/exonuclease/phosphatase (EEP) superfamily protein YafD